MASITADREDRPSSMPGKGKSEEAEQVGYVAVVLLALLLPSPSLLACPLPPVTRCSLHKATILEHAGIKWKWKTSRVKSNNVKSIKWRIIAETG